jgi:Tfp pilus assembly protein PilF
MLGTGRIRAVAIAAAIACVILGLSSCARDPEKGKQLYLESGKNYMKNGKYREAAIQFRNAAKLDPRFVDAYYQLAQANQIGRAHV